MNVNGLTISHVSGEPPSGIYTLGSITASDGASLEKTIRLCILTISCCLAADSSQRWLSLCSEQRPREDLERMRRQ
ncbi:hypothetical protein K1719_005436 [Acacia pycnantha]|nr:hypothetical protein K1719_005436 [Acacia pycnantha]